MPASRSVRATTRDDLDAAVVAVEPDLGQQHPNDAGFLVHRWGSSLSARFSPCPSFTRPRLLTFSAGYFLWPAITILLPPVAPWPGKLYLF